MSEPDAKDIRMARVFREQARYFAAIGYQFLADACVDAAECLAPPETEETEA